MPILVFHLQVSMPTYVSMYEALVRYIDAYVLLMTCVHASSSKAIGIKVQVHTHQVHTHAMYICMRHARYTCYR